jgi:hypothetical protein
VEINLNAGGSADLLTNDVTLDSITTGGDFTLEASSGDITLNGAATVPAGFPVPPGINAGGGVSLLADNGSINAINPYTVTANGNSLFATPNGTIGVVNGPVNVDILGNLILDIGARIGLNSGILTGVVNNPPSNLPLFLPSSFPSPLIPPGNVWFNGVRIWPSESEFELSQASSGLLGRFVFPDAQRLALTQVNTFDPSTSSAQSGGGGLFLYHPLMQLDSGAFDQEFQLDEGAFDFIDGEILRKGR